MTTQPKFHEDYARRDDSMISSDRSFCLVFFAFFVLLFAWPLMKGRAPRFWALAIGLIFLAVGLLRPSLLRPMNIAWHRLGIFMGTIANTVVTGLLFYVIVTPLGILYRFMGKEFLALRFDSEKRSYWIPRDKAGTPPSSMNQQF